MIYSMTGYGKAEGNVGERKVKLQIRSLNSKHLDLNLRPPSLFKEMEPELRKLISAQLYRGKVEASISIERTDSNDIPRINKKVFRFYYEDMSALADELGADKSPLMATVSRFPEIFSSEEQSLDDEEKKQFLSIWEDGIQQVIQFRKEEGASMKRDLEENVEAVESGLNAALAFENSRIKNIRERIQQKLEEQIDPNSIDRDRLEQEMIYYLEKFDVSEEKVRLQAHCEYFRKTLVEGDQQGKKLNFISQEMGREINTLGSKANHAQMQQEVVKMKESLEKIKEQVLNIL